MNVLDLMASLRLDSSEYEKGLDESEKKATSFGDKLKGALATSAKISATALASAGTAVIAVGKGLMDNVGALAEYGDNIDKMSQKLGMSRQAYQEWDEDSRNLTERTEKTVAGGIILPHSDSTSEYGIRNGAHCGRFKTSRKRRGRIRSVAEYFRGRYRSNAEKSA